MPHQIFMEFTNCNPTNVACTKTYICNHAWQKNHFKVKNSNISETVILTAKGRVNAHEWQYTTDVVDFKNRVAADTTTTSITEIKNLEEATKYAFFHKAIRPGTPTDWEGPLLLVIT